MTSTHPLQMLLAEFQPNPAANQPLAVQKALLLARHPVLQEGRIKLLWYVREQSLSADHHRYGNLGTRAAEDRAAVL